MPTSLNDRIAGTLSSLRASFFEEELKPLIRRGVVQLAIDGFDELSDSRGYERAWGALRDFIRDLRGQGTCLLAGRDTMLDADTVRGGLGNTVGEDSLIFLRLRHPPADEVRKWMSHRPDWCDRARELNLLEKQIEDSEYLRHPFFISKIADLGPDGFRDTQDVRGADLTKVRFSNTVIFELLADPYVRFGDSVPDVHPLIMYEHFKGTRWHGKPADWIAERCSRLESDDPEPDERLDLLYKFARISMRQYAIRSETNTNDPISRKAIGSPSWPALRALLEKYERLEVTTSPPASGPKSEWFHLVAGPEFLDPEHAKQDTTRAILRELNAG